MSGRRLYLDPNEFGLDEVALSGERASRLRDVLRVSPGAPLRVFDGLGSEREAVVASVGRGARGAVTLALGEQVEPAPEPAVPVVLVCAFPRGSRGDWLVEKATELGAAALVPTAASRSVMAAGEGRVARWRRIAIEAAEQCGRAVVPPIGGKPPEGVALVAHPGAPTTVRAALAAAPKPRTVVLHIGPEGGWSEAEVEAFADHGAVAVSLGPRLLRVETAALVALAQTLEATGGLARNVTPTGDGA